MENENNNLNLTSSRIKQMRLDKGWTQKDLAKMLGLKNDTAIANYEAGYSTPKDDIKLKMCELFNCSIDYLMGKSKYKNESDFFEINRQITNKILELGTDKNLDIDFQEMEKNISLLIEINNPLKFDNTLTKYLSNFPIHYRPIIDNYIRVLVDYGKNFPIKIKKPTVDLDEQEFRFAYHKEMEGLTDEEITDALRFYKEMKKKVKGENN